LIRTAITAGVSRVASGPLCLHAVATTPAGSMELIRSYGSIHVGLPQITDGSAPALTVSRPAQRSLTLQPADSPSRLMRPSTPEAPAALLPPPPLRLLPGGAIQFPGGSFVPLWTSAFSRRTANAWLQQLSLNSKRRGRTFPWLLQLRILRFGFFQDRDVVAASFQSATIRDAGLTVWTLAAGQHQNRCGRGPTPACCRRKTSESP
jgi:hypothetical protein